MEIVPNVSIGGLAFGSSPAAAEALWGPALATTKTSLGEVNLRYAHANLTYDDSGLVEGGITPEGEPVVGGRRPLSSKRDFDALVREDGQAGEVHGFIVLRRLGVAITGVHDGDTSQRAVAAFRPGRWDSLVSQMRPFKLGLRWGW